MSDGTHPRLVLGLSGYARAGKDAAARALLEEGWQRRAFADKMRDFCYAADPLIPVTPRARLALARRSSGGVTLNERLRAFTPPWRTHERLAGLVDRYGWDAVKVSCDEVRRTLQRTGTDAGRNVLGQDVWVRAATEHLPEGHVVFTDVRFPQEADAVRALRGKVIRIVRPGTGPVNGHSSEIAMDDYPFDAVIVNDGTQDDLHRAIRKVAA